MAETARIADMFEQTFEGKPYYGPSILASLEHVGAAAAARKTARVHSIWELVGHLTAELDYARALLQGTAGRWIEGETTWRAVTNTSAAAWRESIEDLKRANRTLVDAIKHFDDGILSQKAAAVDRPYYVILHGTMQHNIYHSGQISLLSRQIAQADLEVASDPLLGATPESD
jgi:uncharacterized damage-inducible protein DinB